MAEKVSEDVKSALKSGDKKKLAIARFLSSELKNFLIKENLDRELSKISEENFFKIVKTQVKQKKESLEFAEKANDPIMIENLNFDIEYLNSYLPSTLNEEATKEMIINYIKDHQFTAKDFGKLMGLLKKNHSNQIDLNLASNIIKKVFSE
ncbi:GatB/YqeY domain-containing protein [Alphaproteobacteria bacterium]|nr:GatB/YqeY domain-containing protein [Alphaproteobacteria bacterium]